MSAAGFFDEFVGYEGYEDAGEVAADGHFCGLLWVVGGCEWWVVMVLRGFKGVVCLVLM